MGRILEKSGHLTEYPITNELIFIDGPADITELNAQLAYYGYRVVGTKLIQLAAHHPIENPDSLGRPVAGVAYVLRDHLRLYVEFWRVGVNVDVRQQALGGSGQVQRFAYLTVPGVQFDVGNTSERSFSEAVILGDSDAQALEGRTQFRTAGIQFSGLVGLVNPRARVTGTLSVSSFLGSGIERAEVTVPINLDMVLGRWTEVAHIDGADVNAGLAFKSLDWSLDAGAERIVIRVRVDPVIDTVSAATKPDPDAELEAKPVDIEQDARDVLQPESVGDESP